MKIFQQCLQQHEYKFLIEILASNPDIYGIWHWHMRNYIFNTDDFKMVGEESWEEVKEFVQVNVMNGIKPHQGFLQKCPELKWESLEGGHRDGQRKNTISCNEEKGNFDSTDTWKLILS